MAEQVVSLTLEIVGNLLVDEAKFLYGVKDEVEDREKELEILKSFLKDANAKQHGHERVRTCLRQAKYLAYRAEDIIEEYVAKVSSRKGRGIRKAIKGFVCKLDEGIIVHKVGVEICKLKEEISKLIRSLEAFGINRIIEAQPSVTDMEQRRRLRTTYAHEIQEYFVGMEEDVRKLVAWTVQDDGVYRVISISGIGGLGKTTLARKVYNHTQVQNYFEASAWVCITQQCQTKSILQDILTQLLGYDTMRVQDTEGIQETDLVRQLFEVQKVKKCLVVLDDIWKLVDWEGIRHAFPIGDTSCKSKILLTTRNTEVAEISHHLQHTPRYLDEEDGWKLLKMTALLSQEDQGKELPQVVEHIGKEMVRKCGGLPLAISALGGTLRNKDPLTEWQRVNNEIDKYLTRQDGIVSVLALSYNDLPYYLKQCFLYMGSFGEDNKYIDTMDLYYLWMAEGLVSFREQRSDQSLMDVADEYLNELAARNMVHVQLNDLPTTVRKFSAFKLHDLMKDLCLEKGKEEEFFEVKSIEFDHAEVVTNSASNVLRFRRRDVETSSPYGQGSYRLTLLMRSKFEPKWFRNLDQVAAGYLRALTLSVPSWKHLIEGSINLSMLRSLILDRCRFKDNKLLREISNMIHLRLLSLNDCGLDEIPSFLGDLKYLQILRADNSWASCPNIFYKMKRLTHLCLPWNRGELSHAKRLQFHGLNELEILTGYDSRYDLDTDLQQLVNIRVFSGIVYGYAALSNYLELIPCWRKVRSMYIRVVVSLNNLDTTIEKNFAILKKLFKCFYMVGLELTFPIGKLPQYEPGLCTNLVYLHLIHTLCEEDPMQFLKKLPNLKELQFSNNAFVGREICCDSEAFPKLTYLKLEGFPNIELWRLNTGSMPNLSSLEIVRCKCFEIAPADGLNNITSLTWLNVIGMAAEFDYDTRWYQRANKGK